MKHKAREFQAFLYSQNFYDGLRITAGVLLPALLMGYLGHFAWGLSMSLGAIGASLPDSPGPVVHKRNGMLASILLCTVTALVTGFARVHPVLLGVEVLVWCFGCSMLLLYGMRASLVGLAALLVMILGMGQPVQPGQEWWTSAMVLAGGLWYLLLSLVSFQVMPYRPAQQALGECMREVARFLLIKASFYRPQQDLEAQYRKLVTQQVLVSEKQDAVRELLFKSRQVVRESTDPGRALVMTFVDLVDLYEQITAIHYDYATIQAKFGATGILEKIASLIERLAHEMDNMGFALQANLRHTNRLDLGQELDQLKSQLDQVGEQLPQANLLVLKKVFINIRTIAQRLADILSYANAQVAREAIKHRKLEFGLFVTKQNFDPKIFLSNLTLNSSVFRFSVRVALVSLFTFVLTQLVPYGHHSYWVLLTVVFLLKPAFSLTKERNYQRVIGTLVGGAIGLLVLYLVPGQTLRFLFLLVFMVGFYSVQRMNYVLSVVLMTPFMLLLFSFLSHEGGLAIVEERVVDTLIGCGIALAATYLVLPNWESKQVGRYQEGVLVANLRYLQVLSDALSGKNVPEVQYKLARKEVYVRAANLSAAFQRMVAEPKKKQRQSKELFEFVVLNHVLSSYIATVASEKLRAGAGQYPKAFLRPLRRAILSLVEALKQLDPTFQSPEPFPAESPDPDAPFTLSEEDLLLGEQLEFIWKVCADIQKKNLALSKT